MQVQVNTANNIEGREALMTSIEQDIRNRLARFESRLTRVEVHVGDENGERTEGDDKRCVIEARPAGLGPVTVTEQAGSIDQATSGALAKMTTALDRTFGKQTNRKGH
ncbi:HPF/RaiA family ribosome-associated protein [Phenylobacterium sp.]|uniref:HPF/RaiA family ribosome-associated protein n=1 Tax=Phenylobacterium sp. TaxID=1871053 RepID=UPI00272F92CC|nr:HPF/RaiA family ribosome-associated protein [Phenylobacterium sp.]MDP2212604.1 HPF/RaiA family ribosome-associated protein [Phenylobacterium sp.]